MIFLKFQILRSNRSGEQNEIKNKSQINKDREHLGKMCGTYI